MKEQNPFEVFQKESPEVFAGFNGLVESLMNTKALDPKTKQLIYLGIKAAQGDQTAVMFHVPMAKKLGAGRDEIKRNDSANIDWLWIKRCKYMSGRSIEYL